MLAVYFGNDDVKQNRDALACALLADAVVLAVAVLVGYAFFH